MRYSLLLFICLFTGGLSTAPLSAQTIEMKADGQQWLKYDQHDSRVQAGSALDFSFLIDSDPAGHKGHAIINDQGLLAFSRQPDKAIHVMSCALPMIDFEPVNNEQVIALAQQIQLAGYTAVRPHWLDLYLMTDAPDDLVFNTKHIALYDRFAFELKQRGIYLILDVVTSSTMYMAIDHPFNNKHSRAMNKLQMYYDTQYQEHWKRGAELLMNHVNPHTSMALKDDPQILYMAARNEPGIGFQLSLALNNEVKNKVYIQGIAQCFGQWLKKQYHNIEQLQKAWGDAGNAIRDFSDVRVPPKKNPPPAVLDDFQKYIVEAEKDTYVWMFNYLQSLGVQCSVIDYNCGMAVQCGMTRAVLPMVDMHAYHDHPQGWGVKAKLNNNSLVGTSAAMAFRLAGTRQLGAPFGVSEWGNPYFNEYRHEAGLVMGAYASLQNWQMIMQHAMPVELSTDQVPKFFRVARDPSLKAAERMATLLFASEAVKPAKGIVGIRLDDSNAEKMGWTQTMPSEITKLALVSQLGIQLPNAIRAKVTPDLLLEPQHGATVIALPGAEIANDANQNNDVTGQAIAILKQRGILSTNNRTNVSQNVYQSDTDEIFIDSNRKFLSINTKTCQGATLAESASIAQLDDVKLINQGAPSACLLASLDGKAIAQSKRMLFIVATNSSATGAEFSENGNQILNFGQLPLLIQSAKVTLRLNHEKSDVLQVWALRANGSRSIQCKTENNADGQMVVMIDQSKLGDNVTPYFEILMPLTQ